MTLFMEVNTYNVVWLLFKEYMAKTVEITAVTEEEIKLKNHICEILSQYECPKQINEHEQCGEALDFDSSSNRESHSENKSLDTFSCDK